MENRQQQILSEIKALASSVRSQMETLESKIAELQQVIENEVVEVVESVEADIMDIELSPETEFYSEPVPVDAYPEPEPEPAVLGPEPVVLEPEPAVLEPEPQPVVYEPDPVILNDVQSSADVPVIDAMLSKHAWRTDMPGTAVKDIRSAISLNDRILFINFLFNEDPMSFQETLTKLNSMASFDEAATYMMTAFPHWNWESDAVYRFMMALRRRLQ